MLIDELQRLCAVACLGDDLHFGVCQQQPLQPRACRRFVVDQQHAQGHGRSHGSSNQARAPAGERASSPTAAREPWSDCRR